MADSARTVTMPRLACMKAMRDEAAELSTTRPEGKRGKSGRPMSLGHRFMVKTWINRMEENLSEVEDWLPRTNRATSSGSPREVSRGGREDGRGPSGGGLRRARFARRSSSGGSAGVRSRASAASSSKPRRRWGSGSIRPARGSKRRRGGFATTSSGAQNFCWPAGRRR